MKRILMYAIVAAGVLSLLAQIILLVCSPGMPIQ